MPTQFNNAQLLVLKNEFVNDPRGYGYAAYWAAGYDNGLSYIINAVRDGVVRKALDGVDIALPTIPTGAGGTANGHIVRNKLSVTPMEVMGVIDVRDFIANANNLQAAWFESLMQIGGATIPLANQDGTKTFIRTNLDRAVNDTNGSQARLDSLAVRFGSRAEELFGTGVVVSVDDVSASHSAA